MKRELMNRKIKKKYIHWSTVQFSCSVMSNSLRHHEPQHARPPCPSPTPEIHPNPCPLSWWCHPAILSSVIPFCSCPQFSPASGSFQMSQLFASGGQSIGVSASTSVLSMNIQDWSPLGWSAWISLQSKGLSRVFSNTAIQKHQFFATQLSYKVQLSHPYMTTGKTIALTWWTWVWVNSRSWWWTGRPGVLWFMGSQRVGHDWATEMNWTELKWVLPTLPDTVQSPGDKTVKIRTLSFRSLQS